MLLTDGMAALALRVIENIGVFLGDPVAELPKFGKKTGSLGVAKNFQLCPLLKAEGDACPFPAIELLALAAEVGTPLLVAARSPRIRA